MRATVFLIVALTVLAGCSPAPSPQAALEKTAQTRVAAFGISVSKPGAAPELVTGGCARFGADGHTCTVAFTADSPVRIASISKLVTVIGAMRLVEQGVLDLDADVSVYLKFQLHNPAFPDRPVTLRQIFSHTASIRDGDDFVIPLGAKLSDAMIGAAHWDSAHAPGSYFTYSNLGLIIAATAMEGATGERFDRLMQRLVFQPLGLEATYNWSGASAAVLARAAALYRTAGNDEKWHPDGPFIAQVDDRGGAAPDCPAPVIAPGFSCNLDVFPPGTNAGIFSPQGGLRISLNDLIRIARLLSGKGEVDGVRLLKPETLTAFAAPVWMLKPDGSNGATGEASATRGMMCAWGTGFHLLGAAPGQSCHDDVFADGGIRFGHAAEAYGLIGGLWVEPASGIATVYFVTGTSDDMVARGGKRSGFTQIEEALAAMSRP